MKKDIEELIELAEDMFLYVPEYFRGKYHYEEDLSKFKDKLKNLGEGEAGTGYALLADGPQCEAERYMFGKVLFQRLNKDSLWYAVYNNQIIDWDRYRSDLEERCCRMQCCHGK